MSPLKVCVNPAQGIEVWGILDGRRGLMRLYLLAIDLTGSQGKKARVLPI